MTPNIRMEQLSLTYIRAVAAQAGFQVSRPEVDLGIDGYLLSDFNRRPQIGFQAKATAQEILQNGVIRFPLPIKNYNDLRADSSNPLILIVLLMPEDDTRWAVQSSTELCLHHCAYWLSLEGMPVSDNTSSVTIQIPEANIFSVDQLTDLMYKAGLGESLC